MSKKNVTLSDEVITEKEHARRYEEETNLRCHILIDSSSSMMFPLNQPYNKFTFSLDAAAALIFLMRKQISLENSSVYYN